MGAAIGTALGLGAGALIGDQLQGRENQAYDQDQQINANQQELPASVLNSIALRSRMANTNQASLGFRVQGSKFRSGSDLNLERPAILPLDAVSGSF